MPNILRRSASEALFARQVGKAIARCKGTGKSFALLALRVEELERVEGLLGHEAGKAIVYRLGRRIKQALRPDDRVIRIGDDDKEGVSTTPEVGGAAGAGRGRMVVCFLTSAGVAFGRRRRAGFRQSCGGFVSWSGGGVSECDCLGFGALSRLPGESRPA